MKGLSEEQLDFFNHLLQLGCCKLCAVRYLGKISLYVSVVEKVDIIEPKKVKGNPCIVCLGLLQQDTLNQILTSQKLNLGKEYHTEVFTCSISMPASILIREHSMKIYLEDKFANLYEDNAVVPLNKAWKIYVKNELRAFMEKEFENSDVCNFSINISMEYLKDMEELSCLKKIHPHIHEDKNSQRKKHNGEMFSRKGLHTAFLQIQSNIFRENYPVPPQIPSDFLTLKDIECKHNSIFCAGRYLKFSRKLCQSPWIVDGIKAMDTSVQEIIFNGIENVFNISDNNLKFSSSGREDCDVRCLGKGRPFYIEFIDPKRAKFSFEEFRKLETVINQSDMIKVQHLQHVNRSELSKIKEGEEIKTKDYNALCLAKEPITQEQVHKINNYGEVEILQKTPIRVLHRRPLAVRNRVVYEMKAALIEGWPNLVNLHLNTQAGTYVKEFVHGDFGRTIPSIGEIIGSEVDIVALDVTAINLDWPREINYSSIENVT